MAYALTLVKRRAAQTGTLLALGVTRLSCTPPCRLAASFSSSEWAIGVLVELELPLFHQGQGRVAAALSEMRREKSNFEGLALRLRAGAREMLRDYWLTRLDAEQLVAGRLPSRELGPDSLSRAEIVGERGAARGDH